MPVAPDPPHLHAPLPVRLLEYHVAHDCNLTCELCSHFAPFARRRDVTRTQLERDLASAAAAFAPEVVHILGGEPLLNRELPELLPLFRRYHPASLVKLVTNGVLLARAPAELYRALRESGVSIAVSLYPGVELELAALQQVCATEGLPLELWQQDTFLDFFDPAGIQDARAARAACPMEDALNVRDGRVYPCPVSAWADLAGFPHTPEDGVSPDAPAESLRALTDRTRLTSMCRHCRAQPARVPHRLAGRRRRGSLELVRLTRGGPAQA